jgi:hypothetical protein
LIRGSTPSDGTKNKGRQIALDLLTDADVLVTIYRAACDMGFVLGKVGRSRTADHRIFGATRHVKFPEMASIRKRSRVLSIIAALATLGAACGGDESSAPSSSSEAPSSSIASSSGGASAIAVVGGQTYEASMGILLADEIGGCFIDGDLISAFISEDDVQISLTVGESELGEYKFASIQTPDFVWNGGEVNDITVDIQGNTATASGIFSNLEAGTESEGSVTFVC